MMASGWVACVELDLKKVIAISTLSQLSVMVFSLSIGLWKMAYLHVVLHALFKSLLFLACGSIMVHVLGGQDSRGFGYSFGGTAKLCFFSRGVRLVGFPFSVGFLSKDTILLTGSFLFLNVISLFLFFTGCLFTVFYTVRLVYYGFVLEPYIGSFQENRESWRFGLSVFFLWGWSTFSVLLFI